MADISTGQASVTTAAAVVVPYDLAGKAVILQNTGSATIYVGGVGVTTGNGFPIAAGVSTMPLPVNEPIYALTASGTSTLAYIEANS